MRSQTNRRGRLAGAALTSSLLAAGGCILPVATGTPMPATTVGQGNFGTSVSGEAPVLDLLADGTDYADLRGAAPAAALTVTVAYGMGEDTDLEVAGEGALYFFILPLPTGGSIGLRHRVISTDVFDLALAGKIGGVSSSGSTTVNGNTTESGASALYGAAQVVIQRSNGWVRPLAAINLMPFQISRDPSDEPSYRFKGLATSLTVGVMAIAGRLQIGPYFTATNFTSQRFTGGTFPSFGLMFSLRPQPRRAQVAATSETPYFAPDPAPPPPPPPPPMYPPGAGAPPPIPDAAPAPPPPAVEGT